MMQSSKIRYVIMCIPRGGHPYPVYNSVIKEDAMRECTQRNKYDTNKGLFYVQTIYPIALMKQANLDNFIQQVAEVRMHEKKFWNEGRSKEELNISLDLESKLDKYLDHCKAVAAAHPEHKPQPEAKAFFDLIDKWRTKSKEYFKYKKQRDCEPEVVRERLKEVKAMEKAIDDVITQYNQYDDEKAK